MTFANGEHGESLTDTACSGVWNTTEAIPLLFRSAQIINVLPDIDDVRVTPLLDLSHVLTRL